jgi:uncharacterized protein
MVHGLREGNAVIGDTFVFNAVAHAYDVSDDNTRDNRYAHAVREQVVAKT